MKLGGEDHQDDLTSFNGILCEVPCFGGSALLLQYTLCIYSSVSHQKALTLKE